MRETLTLQSASVATSYRYALSLSPGLKATLAKTGGVTIEDVNGATVYWVAAPTIADSGTSTVPSTAPVHYELSEDGTALTLVVDKSWLDDPARVFPVTVDPSVVYTAAEDCSIANQSSENTSLCSGPLYVGDTSATPKTVKRSMLQLNLSSIPKGSIILSSRLALWLDEATSSTSMELEAYALTRGFTEKATWKSYDGTHSWTTAGGDYMKSAAGLTVIPHSWVGYWVNIGFTPEVEQWVREPSSNYGILLKAHNESTAAVDTFVQADNGKSEPEPNLDVVYEPALGNPGNEAMYQQSLGNGGTLGVNVANGNLHIETPDVRYATEGYATELSRSYNSEYDNLDGSAFGNQWTASMGENTLLYSAWWDGSYAFHQPDGSYARFDRAPWADGHPSAGDKAYTGEAGDPETLVVHSAGTRTLTYNNTGVEWQFDSSENGFPQTITDPGGEKNTISLSYTESLLTKVKDTHGHELTLTRSASTHDVTKIQAGAEAWTYKYTSGGSLESYTGPAGQKAEYLYNSKGGLADIIEVAGTIVVSYDASERVASLRKVVNGTLTKVGSEDEITSFAYETGGTVVTEPTGAASHYYYDAFGNILEEPATQEAASEFYAGYAGIEVGAAHVDVALQDHAAILDSQLSEQLGGNYVGEWFNSSTGHVELGITSAGYEQTVEQDVDDVGLAEKTTIVAESASLTQLEEAQEALSAELTTLTTEGLVVVGVKPSADAVTLEESSALTSGQKATVSEAIAKRSVTVHVTVSSARSVTLPLFSCEYASCTAPLRGGVRLQSSGYTNKEGEKRSSVCTAGYIATADYGGAPYLVTAGHCIADSAGVGRPWYAKYPLPAFETARERAELAPVVEIGDAHADVYGATHENASDSSKGDMGIIAISSASEWFHGLQPIIITYGNSEVPRNEHYKIFGSHFSASLGGSQIGFVVCASGAEPIKGYGEADCGMEEGFTSNGATEHLERLNVCYGSKHATNLTVGSSGAPVYKDGLAFGIIIGGGGCTLLYQGISSIEGALHVRVLHALS